MSNEPNKPMSDERLIELGKLAHECSWAFDPGQAKELIAEIDRLRSELAAMTKDRDGLETKLGSLLCRLTNNKFSKTDYSVDDMERFIDDEYDVPYQNELAAMTQRAEVAEADNAALKDMLYTPRGVDETGTNQRCCVLCDANWPYHVSSCRANTKHAKQDAGQRARQALQEGK